MNLKEVNVEIQYVKPVMAGLVPARFKATTRAVPYGLCNLY